MTDTPSLFPEDDKYVRFLTNLKARIRGAQLRAALSVNQELLLLYWNIGRDLLARQQQEGWGSKIITRLAKDLKQEFPEIKGFSRSNLFYMRSFADAYPDEQIVQPTFRATKSLQIYFTRLVKNGRLNRLSRVWEAIKIVAIGAIVWSLPPFTTSII